MFRANISLFLKNVTPLLVAMVVTFLQCSTVEYSTVQCSAMFHIPLYVLPLQGSNWIVQI